MSNKQIFEAIDKIQEYGRSTELMMTSTISLKVVHLGGGKYKFVVTNDGRDRKWFRSFHKALLNYQKRCRE